MSQNLIVGTLARIGQVTWNGATKFTLVFDPHSVLEGHDRNTALIISANDCVEGVAAALSVAKPSEDVTLEYESGRDGVFEVRRYVGCTIGSLRAMRIRAPRQTSEA